MVNPEWIRQAFAHDGKTMPQPASDWKGEFPLPPSLEVFYRDIGPVDIRIGEEHYGNGWFIPRLSALWQFQEGYRWHANTGERTEDWLDDWLAVATDFNDVFILSMSSGEVSVAPHGAGLWYPVNIFPDIIAMSACFGLLTHIAADLGEQFDDDDCVIRPEALERLLVAMTELCGSRPQAQTVLQQLGIIYAPPLAQFVTLDSNQNVDGDSLLSRPLPPSRKPWWRFW